MNNRLLKRGLLAYCWAAILVSALLSLGVDSALAELPVINEFLADHLGSDTHEFIEIYGDPNTSYAIYTILVIEGDTSSNTGRIDDVFPVGMTDNGGFWTTGFLAGDLENGTMTLLLVEDFYGSVGDDLDPNDDGQLDVLPFLSIVDDVAVQDEDGGELVYSPVVLAPGFDFNPYTPGGASRIPNGQDTGTLSDWVRNDFGGAGLPGFGGTPAIGEALNTPGSENLVVVQGVDAVINEFLLNHIGSDTHEFIEIFGDPNASYEHVAVLEIEGDVGSNAGKIDGVFNVYGTDGGGFWTTGFLAGALENGSLTLLLVEGFSGSAGDDLDLNDDGILDVLPFVRVIDDVAVTDNGAGDQVYSTVVLAPDYDGNALMPGGASRIPNGQDTDSVTDWIRNDFGGEGLPGFEGTPEEGEAYNTPGLGNSEVGDIAVEKTTWGKLKSIYKR
jgi:hypothetical protein